MLQQSLLVETRLSLGNTQTNINVRAYTGFGVRVHLEKAKREIFETERRQKLQQAISDLLFASVSERLYVRNYSFQNEFRLQVHFQANQTHFSTRTRFQREAHGNPEMAYLIGDK